MSIESQEQYPENTDEQAAIFSALADPTRLKLMKLLQRQRDPDALCVNALAGFLGAQYRKTVDPDHLFVTGGVSQALDMICALKTRPGDTVIVEEPSYFLALRIFSDYNLKVIGTPIDENGIIIETLEKKLKKHNPTFVYTIPVYHNPAGVTLSTKRRKNS